MFMDLLEYACVRCLILKWCGIVYGVLSSLYVPLLSIFGYKKTIIWMERLFSEYLLENTAGGYADAYPMFYVVPYICTHIS